MRFYEYHVHPEVDLEGMLAFLEKLGWKGCCLVCDKEGDIREYRKKARNSNLDVFFGYMIRAGSPHKIAREARRMRKKAEIVLVHGGSLEINRKACETPEVDVLAHPELERRDSGFDSVMAKLVRENNVSIEFNFRNLLQSYDKSRSDVFSNMLENAKLVRKYKAPYILTSGAVEPYGVRSPSDLLSFGNVLGLPPKTSKKSLSPGIIMENRKRLGKKWIMPGVELE